MNTARWSGVIFDFDETLVDVFPSATRALKIVSKDILHYLNQHGLRLRLEDVYQVSHRIAEEMDRKASYERNSWWQMVISNFLDSKPPEYFLSRLTDVYWTIVTKQSVLYNDTLPVLQYLKEKDYLLGLMTDTDGVTGMKRERIAAAGLNQYFSAIVIAGEDNKNTKPAEEPFYLIADKLGLPTSKCVFIGDKPFLDVVGAQRAGMGTILVQRRQWGDKTKPDIVVNSLHDLKQVL